MSVIRGYFGARPLTGEGAWSPSPPSPLRTAPTHQPSSTDKRKMTKCGCWDCTVAHHSSRLHRRRPHWRRAVDGRIARRDTCWTCASLCDEDSAESYTVKSIRPRIFRGEFSVFLRNRFCIRLYRVVPRASLFRRFCRYKRKQNRFR